MKSHILKLLRVPMRLHKLTSRLAACFIVLGLFWALPADAYFSLGPPQGYVTDLAELIPDDEEQQLEDYLSSFTASSSNEIAVVTIPSLEGDAIENFAVKLFEEWGIGKEKQDNGILLLVARDDREMRIEVGYGLEGVLTDAESAWIIRDTLTPAFRGEAYSQGIREAVESMAAITKGEYIPNIESGSSDTYFTYLVFGFIVFQWLMAIFASSKSWWLGGIVGALGGVIAGFIWGFVYTGILLLMILIPVGLLLDFLASRSFGASRKSSRNFWRSSSGWSSRGGGGGGFGGFSGGSSGGGGASGRW